MTVSYAFWCSRRDARVMGSNSARSICRYYPAGTPPCPPYMPGCNTKIRQANFDSRQSEQRKHTQPPGNTEDYVLSAARDRGTERLHSAESAPASGDT